MLNVEQIGYSKGTKLVAVEKYHKGGYKIICGPIEYLRDDYFGYTLECGNSWNENINRWPKTGASLVTALNKSYHETQGGSWDPDSARLVKKEELEAIYAKNPAQINFVGKD